MEHGWPDEKAARARRLVRIAATTVAVAMLGTAPAASSPVAKEGPCAGLKDCPLVASTLQRSWDESSPHQREKMKEIIRARTAADGTVDWKAVADEYMPWRVRDMGIVTQAPPSTTARPDANWRDMRELAEKAIRRRLIDPDSARIEWPHGFFNGTWKPLLGKRVEGYVTCGLVNSRNRFGGYVGATAFVVVMDTDYVKFLDIDTSEGFNIVATQCAKAAPLLPRAPSSMFDEPRAQAGRGTSIADEIEKLAKLRERGLLTDAEFQAQKSKLLGGK